MSAPAPGVAVAAPPAPAAAGTAAAPAAVATRGAASSSSGSFQLTPLYGCESGAGGAVCSVLRLDDFVILLDIGWDERYSESQLSSLRAIAPTVDLVLITQPDLAHLGALPYAVGKLGLTAPVMATLPVWRMGQMFMYSAWQERFGQQSGAAGGAVDADAAPFTLDDVDRAFDQMRQLKYSQTVRLTDKGEGIEVTPSCAGHMLGGAFWHIKRETESIIYAVDFNHASERHLNGALLNAPQLHRPSALITDATNALVVGAKRSAQDQALTSSIAERLRMGGCVLLPVDAAGRVLELLLVIHGFWVVHQLASSYTLAFLSPQSRNTVDFARSQLEWMTDKCRKLFDTSKVNPFALPQVRLISSLEELAHLPKPYCLLASNQSLETSLAQDAFVQLADDPRNLLLFTSRAPSWSVAGQLFDANMPNALRTHMPHSIDIQRRTRVQLEGDELDAYREEQKIKREQMLLETADVDEDEDEELEAGKVESAARRHQAAQLYPLFPYAEPKRSYDVWGETLTEEEVRVWTGQAAQTGPLLSAPTSAAATGGAAAAHSDAMLVDDAHVAPTKSVVHTITVPLRCAVRYIDLEGRSDGRSLRTVLKDVSPRKLILLSGSAAAKESVRAHCLSNSVCSDVVVPSNNQTVSVTTEMALYRVNLKESYLHSLQFVSVGDEYEVAYADGQLALHYQQGAHLPVLAQSQAPTAGHPAVFLGQFKPQHLQQQLLQAGVQCELVDGVLVCCQGLVNVRKLNATQISIQGALCEEYFHIRDVLYGQYEIV